MKVKLQSTRARRFSSLQKSRRIWIETMERAKKDADAFSEKVFSKRANGYGRKNEDFGDQISQISAKLFSC
ncbi:hypothetical protein Bca4012_015174 [Brassica carinata]|uniref:Uncharacterized protein n=1 Tax=Brassica carinata TaxID=52824 RepID=A0A8X7VL30_BRACI|nr:hypothetical protein Bca52824_025011 [Brassica carinata]